MPLKQSMLLERQTLHDKAETKDLVSVLTYRVNEMDEDDCRVLGLVLARAHEHLQMLWPVKDMQ